MLPPSIVRCASCAAPLGLVGHGDVVVCRYCRAENHVAATAEALQAKVQRFQQAADEAQVMETFEGYMGLQYVPTLHVYRAWGLDDPLIAGTLREIDDAVAKAVAAVAESLGAKGG